VVGRCVAGLHRGVGPKIEHNKGQGARYQGSVGCTSTPLTRSDCWKKVRCKGAWCHSFGCATPFESDVQPRHHIQWPSCNNDLPRPAYLNVQTERLHTAHIVVEQSTLLVQVRQRQRRSIGRLARGRVGSGLQATAHHCGAL